MIEDDENEMMAPITIYKSNQLGISINVEEHQEASDKFQEEKTGTFTNPFKRFEQLTSKDTERNPETVSLVNSGETITATSSGRKKRQQPLGRLQQIQGRIYLFLEHPSGWRCFVYHMGV